MKFEDIYIQQALRDYFAAAALQGLLSGALFCNKDTGDVATYGNMAEWAYKYADAMLKARLPTPPERDVW